MFAGIYTGAIILGFLGFRPSTAGLKNMGLIFGESAEAAMRPFLFGIDGAGEQESSSSSARDSRGHKWVKYAGS